MPERRGQDALVTRQRGKVSLGTVIASRAFTLRGGGAAELKVGLPAERDGDVFCPVQLVGIGDEKIHRIFGVDGVQALQLAVKFLDTLVMGFGDRLLWDGEPARKSLIPEPRALLEEPGFSEFLSQFEAAFAELTARSRPSSRSKPKRKRSTSA